MAENNWIEVNLSEDETVTHQVGPVAVRMKKVANEIWIAHEYHEETSAKKSSRKSFTRDVQWSRWALKDHSASFRFLPVFPDRPVVVKPEYPFQIVPGADVKVYTRIPVFIRIALAERPDFVLTEIPSVIMSNTWFGLFTEGELCYWVSTTARRTIEPEIFKPWLAVCPLRVVNNSDYNLNFEKICLRVEQLSLYLAGDKLWSDETLISYQGGDQLSNIEMKGKLPVEAKGGKIINKPRTPIKKSLAVRSFKMIKERVWD